MYVINHRAPIYQGCIPLGQGYSASRALPERVESTLSTLTDMYCAMWCMCMCYVGVCAMWCMCYVVYVVCGVCAM